MQETATVLKAIFAELSQHGSRLTGTIAQSNGSISVLDGRAHLRVVVHHDKGSHPSLAHGHVVCHIDGDDTSELDTCVIGISEDRERALHSVAATWVPLAAGPIFSHLLNRQVLGAGQFSESNSLGLAGCKGYFGAGITQMMSSDADLAAFEEDSIPVFDYAMHMAPPGRVHLAKVTLQANGENGWTRNLEVNGHRATHVDADWSPAGNAPRHGIFTQTAVFTFPAADDWLAERQQLDDTIREYAKAFQTVDNSGDAAALILRKGTNEPTVNRVLRFAPIAIGRVLLSKLGANFSDRYVRIQSSGEIEEGLHLMREPAFARATMIARELSTDAEMIEPLKTLARENSEVQAITDMLQSGSRPEELQLMPPIIPDPGVSQDVLTTAVEELKTRWESKPS